MDAKEALRLAFNKIKEEYDKEMEATYVNIPYCIGLADAQCIILKLMNEIK